MAVTQLTDIIKPDVFTSYIVSNTMEKTAIYLSGVAARNAVILRQLQAGADSFSVPFWNDLGDEEADIASDDPGTSSTPVKITAGKQVVRKSFLHKSWSAMNLASEMAGSDALSRIESRTTAYWERQIQKRLVSTLLGVKADNVANDSSDMVNDISALTGGSELFSASAVIDTAATLGDAMSGLGMIAMHSDVYTLALKNDLIATEQDSQGQFWQTFRGLAVIVDDALVADGSSDYTSILFGSGAVGFGISAPNIAAGTEIENLPSAGNGGGQQILHSRINAAVHPAGFAWLEGSVAGDSPTIAELETAANWDRVVSRKHVPLAYLVHKV